MCLKQFYNVQMELTGKHRDRWISASLALVTLLAFYFSIKPTQQHFDYTTRIASALLEGHVGLQKPAPSWLNEMVPAQGHWYSVFPLGAVLSMLPVAVLQKVHLIKNFPGRGLAAITAALCAWFFYQLSIFGTKSLTRRIVLSLALIFGTWTWCNLGFGGAWQIALGCALLGQIAALYFVLVDPRPIVAGAFFALAVGNRTEIVLCLPIFLYLLLRQIAPEAKSLADLAQQARAKSRVFLYFLIFPVALGFFSALYNYARFHSFFDFGYAHIPGVLKEPWYQHGLFSFHAIPWNIHKMLFEGFRDNPIFPYISFFPFGCSIFLASPFLFLIFREGGLHKIAIWIAIALLTFALWMHGNPGGWEFSYRYAMVLLPWMFLLIASNGPPKISVIECSLFVVSVTINAVAMYQFLWTNKIHP
ncbi:MAG: hypothetical protein DME57_00950 [Verrucomicrobia bacterium]|nr:MAG: hypothetical protein DME57_00950 [Verrucomicrobiota bacterium]